MNILDEQILESQRQLLRSRRIPVRQIGVDLGRKGMKDQEIITLLLQYPRSTLFTLDFDFAKQVLCHRSYAIVCMQVKKHEAALFVRRILRHPEFDTIAKRLGHVLCLSHTDISVWALHIEQQYNIPWGDR